MHPPFALRLLAAPNSDDEAPSRQPPATHDDKDEAPSRQPPATHDDEDEAPAKQFCAAIPTRRVKDKTTPITGLSAAEMRTLESFCVPRAFYLVLALLGCLDGAVKRDLLGVEYYSGRGWLTSAFQMVGDPFCHMTATWTRCTTTSSQLLVYCVRCGCSCGCGKEA